MSVQWVSRALGVILGLLVVSGTAWAQDSAIAGVVTDASGGVLPGVTVEVSSPALIEGARTAVTDGQGRYSVQNLRPGVYAVSFTLTGFAVVKREGVTLTVGFTAPVNAELKVGTLQETVTVSGASPTVDVQNVRTQNVLTRDTLDTLPNAQTLSSIASLTLGVQIASIVSQDVGGNQGEQGSVTVHANRAADQKISMEGMNTNNSMGTNGGVFHAGQHFNMEAMNEVAMSFNGMTAETETAGAQVNYIPKDGGNRFSITGRATGANGSFQADNLSDDLIARGASSPPKIKKIYDWGGSVGGPVKKDKLWFFTAHRWWGDTTNQPGSFFNKTQGTRVYTPDLSRPGYLENYNRDNSWRITWQASKKDKIGYYGNLGNQCVCYLGVGTTLAPEAASHNFIPENRLTQVTWNRVQTNKLLFDGGFTYLHNPFGFLHEDRPGVEPGTGRQHVGYDVLPMRELSTGLLWNARSQGALPYTDCQGSAPVCDLSEAGQQNGRVGVSLVTGSHSFKVGFNMAHGLVEQNGSNNVLPGFGPVELQFLNGVPFNVLLFAHPKYFRVDFRNSGIFAQDQWTVRRFTLNLGVRGDFFQGYAPEQDWPGGGFVPTFHTDRMENIPTWKNVSPRLGLAWDIQGNGKTAVKVSAGRYIAAAGAGTVQPVHPGNAIVTTATRTWTDLNGDFLPQGDGKNPAANGELGPLTDPAFGTPRVSTFFDADMLTTNRQYTWQFSGSFERELASNVGTSVSYYRTAHFNQTIADNTLVTPADYDTYCVTVYNDPRLPNAGGQLCGLAQPERGKTAAITRWHNESFISGADQTEVFNGVDAEIHARIKSRLMLAGGVSVGRLVNNRCFVVDSPQELYQCEVVTSLWDGNGQIKFNASYTLPLGVEASAVFQNLPGAPILANAVYVNALVAPSLGRNLPSCPADTGPCNSSVTIPLIQPQTEFEKRLTQVDFRVAKLVRGNFGRIRATLDLYNLFNANTVLARNNTVSLTAAGTINPAWGTPLRVLSGRLIKLGAQFNF